VIHAMHHQQDMWKMGGLKNKVPTTYWTFMVGTFALCGIPPFSGFYSKDSVLAAAVDPAHGHPLLFVLGVGVAVLTTFYMFRLVIVTFWGEPKSDAAEQAHESPKVMTVPLMLLAFPSTFVGLFGLDAFLSQQLPVSHPIEYHGMFAAILEPINHSPLAASFGLLAVFVGGLSAWNLYKNVSEDPLFYKWTRLTDGMRHRFYLDEIYQFLIRITHEALSKFAGWFDRFIVSGLVVRGTALFVEIFGRLLRLLQTGNLQTYAFLLVLGLVFVILLTIRVTTH